MAQKIIRTLTVEITASLNETVDEMVEALARVACDVANSIDDDEAHITVWEPQSK